MRFLVEPVSADPYTHGWCQTHHCVPAKKTAQHLDCVNTGDLSGDMPLNLEPGMGPEPLCISLLTSDS